MSIHGNQYLLPFLIKKELEAPIIKDEAELTLAFHLLTKDLKKEEKITSFSRLLWPLLSVQGVISTHIILDGLTVFSKKGKLTNPPRQPLIGHILRNVDERSEAKLLERIIQVLSYKDSEATEIGSSEDSEYQTLFINGLMSPDYLQSLMELIPSLEYLPISKYMPLDTSLSTEIALDISEKYREYFDTMKGNALRWESLIKLVSTEIDKWLTNLNVKIKDVELLYSSKINKLKESIGDSNVKKQKDFEFDKLEQWNVNEKKNVIINISLLFKNIESQLKEIISKNEFFTDEESLKSKVFEDLIQSYETHFNYLKNEGTKFIDSITSFYKKFDELKEQAQKIDYETAKKLEGASKNAQSKLDNRDKQLYEYIKEKETKLKELNTYKNQIESLFNKIKQIVQNKIQTCLNEAEQLKNWSIADTQDELFSKPIQWIYIPIYAIFLENEELMEERINVLFPGYIGTNPASLYENLSDAFVELKKLLNEKFEEDVKTRSNFEFSSEKNNLIKDINFKQNLKTGLSILKNKSLITKETENKCLENLNKLP